MRQKHPFRTIAFYILAFLFALFSRMQVEANADTTSVTIKATMEAVAEIEGDQQIITPIDSSNLGKQLGSGSDAKVAETKLSFKTNMEGAYRAYFTHNSFSYVVTTPGPNFNRFKMVGESYSSEYLVFRFISDQNEDGSSEAKEFRCDEIFMKGSGEAYKVPKTRTFTVEVLAEQPTEVHLGQRLSSRVIITFEAI